MRTDKYAISFQSCQVPPYGRRGNPQSGAEVGRCDSALTGKYLSNAKSALFCEHDVWCAPLPNVMRTGANQCADSLPAGTNCIWDADDLHRKSESRESKAIRNKTIRLTNAQAVGRFAQLLRE
jgi:hypothetical protein